MSSTSEINNIDGPKPHKGLRDVWYSRGGTAFRKFVAVVIYRIYRLVGELTAVVLGLAIVGCWIAVAVLDKQSTDLTALRPNFKIWFAEAFDGQAAEFGKLDLTWLPASDNIVVTIENAEIRGADGEILKKFDLIRSTLATHDNWLTRPRLVNAEVKGGVLTYLEDDQGRITAGLGLPETVGRVGPVYRNYGAPASRKNVRKYLQDIEFIQISDAELYIRNAVSGIDLKSDIDSLRAVFSETGDLTAAAEGNIIQSSGKTPFAVTSVVGQNFENIKIRLKLDNARPDEIAPKKGRFWELQGLSAPVDLTAEVDFSREYGLQSAEIDMSIGAGQFDLLRGDASRSIPINSLITRATLAPGEERMDIQQLDLDSPKLSFRASGFLTELGKLSDGDINSSPTFNLSLENVLADLTPSFPQKSKLTRLNLTGQADVDSRKLSIDRGAFEMFESIHNFNGELELNEANQPRSILFNSTMSGDLTPEQLLSVWPVEAFGGARRWIERSILTGNLTQLDAELSLDEAFFVDPFLTEDRIKLRFAAQNLDVQYMETLPKASSVNGSGNIIGNRLSAEFGSGDVLGAKLLGGSIDIPVLFPKGGNIYMKVDGTGLASTLLKIADHPPFEIARRYNTDPNSLRGLGNMSVEVTRPLLEFFPREDITYQVSGSFTGVNAPFSLGRYEITNGEIEMDANKNRVIMSGPVDIGPWRANMRWQETFGDIGYLTQYGVSGILTPEVLDKLGVPSRSWFDGKAAVLIEAEGTGMDIATATLDVDLSNADLSAERVWMKPAGQPARLLGSLTRTSNRGYLIQDATISGEGIDISGQVELDAEYRPQNIDFSTVKIASLIDSAVKIIPDRNLGRLGVEIDARYLDVSAWTEDLFAERQSNIDVPLSLSGNIDRLVLDPYYEVTDSEIEFAHTGIVTERAKLKALSDGKDLYVELATRDDLKRQLTANVPDASKAISAFLGMDNTTGGRLKVNVNLPAAGEEGAYVGVADMRDFTVIEAPAMAQLLSLASLTGLADTLTSGSMQFDKFKLPFTMLGDDIAIRDARIYGPALGMTANGDIDLDLRVLDFDGTLVPAYTANSILGDIPVLGDIFVQEKDGGLFALTYTISGPFEKTQISVNPLSALTPGFLRGIFKRDRSDVDEAMKEAIEDVTPKTPEEP